MKQEKCHCSINWLKNKINVVSRKRNVPAIWKMIVNAGKRWLGLDFSDIMYNTIMCLSIFKNLGDKRWWDDFVNSPTKKINFLLSSATMTIKGRLKVLWGLAKKIALFGDSLWFLFYFFEGFCGAYLGVILDFIF